MAYININTDFDRVIQIDNLNQLSNNNNDIVNNNILTAQDECRSWLFQYYDVDLEFQDLQAWSQTLTYQARNIVYYSGVGGSNKIYWAKYPYPYFDLNFIYKVGDVVFFKNKIYQAIIKTILPYDSAVIQNIYQVDQPPLNYIPGTPNSEIQWQLINGNYIIPAGTPLTDTNYWDASDPRDQQLVEYMVDITLFKLHTRISPRNIPELRVAKYDEALSWLKKASEQTITPKIMTRQPFNQSPVKWDSLTKQINIW